MRQDIQKNQSICLLDPLDYLIDLPPSSLTALTSSTEGEGGHFFVVEVVGQTGVLGRGVISGELSVTFCVAAIRRVMQHCAPAAATAARWEDVTSLAALIRSAMI